MSSRQNIGKPPHNKGSTERGPATGSPAPSSQGNSQSSAYVPPHQGEPDDDPGPVIPQAGGQQSQGQKPGSKKKGFPGKKGNKNKPERMANPQPGKHPIVFEATAASQAVQEDSFITDWFKAVMNISDTWEPITWSKELNDFYLAVQLNARRQEKIEFQRLAIGAGIMAIFQNVLVTKRDRGEDLEDLHMVDRAALLHATPVRLLATQYGRHVDEDTGEILQPALLKEQLKLVMRLVYNLRTAEPDNARTPTVARMVSSGGWGPLRADVNDNVIFRRCLLASLRDWMKHSEELDYFAVPFETIDAFFSGQGPRWMNIDLPGVNWDEIRWMFEALGEPDEEVTLAIWLERLNAIPRAFYRHQDVLPRPETNAGAFRIFQEHDLRFDMDINWLGTFAEVADEWSQWTNIMEGYCSTSGADSCSQFGSLSQQAITTSESEHQIITYSNRRIIAKDEASLAALIPPRGFFEWESPPRNVLRTEQGLRRTLITSWAQAAIKN